VRKLLVPIDSAVLPENLKKYLKEFAIPMEYEVTLLYVIPIDRNLVHGDLIMIHEQNRETFEATAKALLDTVEADLKALGIEHIVKKQLSGDPAHEIVNMAEKGEFHLIAMCTHGMSVPKRLLIGSVTNKVVHRSEIPVMVIR
jgi:nucleotide-binding universal stress UspA family protein